MLHLIDAAVDVYRFLIGWESGVEIGLANVSAEGVDCLEGRGCVDAERIWANANIGAILLVGAGIAEVARTAVGVVCQVDVGDPGKRGPGIFGERMERQAVDSYRRNLGESGRHS